jgi:hypothetical protein
MHALENPMHTHGSRHGVGAAGYDPRARLEQDGLVPTLVRLLEEQLDSEADLVGCTCDQQDEFTGCWLCEAKTAVEQARRPNAALEALFAAVDQVLAEHYVLPEPCDACAHVDCEHARRLTAAVAAARRGAR